MSKQHTLNYGPKEAQLFVAIRQNDTGKAIWYMMQDGINLNATNNGGMTPLHCAIIMQSQTVVQALIEAGADFNICDKNGCTALHLAIASCNEYIMQSLIDAGAPLDIRDNKGNTPVDCAFQYQQQGAFALLIARHIQCGALLGHTSEELIERYDKFKGSLGYDDAELSGEIIKMLSCLTFNESQSPQNGGGGEIAERGDNLVLREQGAPVVLLPLDLEIGGDNNSPAWSTRRTNLANNKISNWSALGNFFLTLVNKLSVQVLGLHILAMPTDSLTKTPACSASPNQNKQKWWESTDSHRWIMQSNHPPFETKLYHFNQFDYNKNAALTPLGGKTIDDPVDRAFALQENENITQ